MTRTDRKTSFFAYIFLTIFAIVMVFPFVWMFSSSFKTSEEIYEMTVIPENPSLANYEFIFNYSMFPRWFLNSMIVAVVTTISVLFFDSLVGYTLAKYNFPGKNIIFILILSTLMIPTEMLVIPWYIMVSS